MGKIVLIQCCKGKLDRPAKAKDMYISDLFKKSLKYAYSLNPDNIFILSAKYHLIGLEETIAPYDQTLNEMNLRERREWANNVINSLNRVTDLQNDKVIILAGKTYREVILDYIPDYSIPMEGLRIGQQLQFLNEHIYE